MVKITKSIRRYDEDFVEPNMKYVIEKSAADDSTTYVPISSFLYAITNQEKAPRMFGYLAGNFMDDIRLIGLNSERELGA